MTRFFGPFERLRDDQPIDADACRDLWCAVLKRAVDDACVSASDARDPTGALQWLLSDASSFVIYLVGLDPDAVRSTLRKDARRAAYAEQARR